MKKLHVLLSAFAVMLFFCACEKLDTNYNCSNLSPTYTGTIKQILDSNCAGSSCHSASNKADGIDLSSYSAASSAANNDRFMGAINHFGGYSAMPRGSAALSFSDREQIHCWIQNGMPQ